MESEEHFIGDLVQSILGQLQIDYPGGALEGVRLDRLDLITLQVQFHEVRETAKESIGFYTCQLIIA